MFSSALNRGMSWRQNLTLQFDLTSTGFDTKFLFRNFRHSPRIPGKSRKMKTIIFTCIELLHAVTEFDARNHQMLPVIWLKNWILYNSRNPVKILVEIPESQSEIEKHKMFSLEVPPP